MTLRKTAPRSSVASEEFPLDLDAVDEGVFKINEYREALHSRGIVTDVAINAGALYIGVFSLVRVHVTTLSDIPTPGLAALLGLPLLAAAATTAFTRWKARRHGYLTDADELSQKIQRELTWYDTRGWLRRTILNGIGLGAVVGIPFGILAAALGALPDAAGGNAVLAVPIIAGYTCLCTIPMSLFFRWASVRHHRKFLAPSHLTSAE